MKSTPYTFQEAAINLIKQGYTIREAFYRARATYPDLYKVDKEISADFSENSWFFLITAAKTLSSEKNIPLKEAIARIYETNPALMKELLGRTDL